jgi:hypothetical protein
MSPPDKPPEDLAASLVRDGYLPDPAREGAAPVSSGDAIAEEALVMRLLAGLDDNDPNKPKFLDPDSPDGKLARAALAKQLREGRLGGFAKEFLALAIDPWTESTWPGMRPMLKITFARATSGPKPTWARDLLIVHFIREQLRDKGGKEDAALKAAETKFGLGKSQTHAIWKRAKMWTYDVAADPNRCAYCNRLQENHDRVDTSEGPQYLCRLVGRQSDQ